MKTISILNSALTLLACAVAFCCPATTLPDSLIRVKANSNKIIYIDGRPTSAAEIQHDIDSIRQVVSMFYYDQFRHFQDPDAPYFLFMSKDAKLAMGVGGGVRMRAYYDWGGAVPTTAFAPVTIPIPADPAAMRRFGTVPSGSYLFARVIGRNRFVGDYQLYIECDFSGYERLDFRLKKAYATVRDFTIGYATSTFSDPAAQPAVIDAAGPNNKLSRTAVLIRYMPCIRRHWHLGISAETPSVASDVSDGITKATSNTMPDFAALAQYQWENGQHVRFSGIVRRLGYRDLKAGRNRAVAGWGIQLSSVAHPLPALTTYANINYGHGIAGLTGDLQYGAYDLVADPSDPAAMYAPRSLGWNIGLQYNFTHMLFASISASQNRFLPRPGISPDQYKYGIFACANIFWNITPRVTLAAEYDWGTRHNISGAHRQANRANLMVAFTF